MTSSEGDDEAGQIARLFGLANFLHVPVVAGCALLAGTSLALAAGLSAAAAAAGLIASRVGPAGRIPLAISLMAQPAIAVDALAGHAWQVDAHMYFFAMLAALTALVNVPALIAATLLVAVHHVVLNFAFPALIYPGGTDTGRTAVHAVVLLAEAGALIAMVLHRQKLTREARERARVAEAAQAETVAMEEATEREREATFAMLEAEFASVVEQGVRGDFSGRIAPKFSDDAVNRLATGLNGLFTAVDSSLGRLEERLGRVAEGDLRGGGAVVGQGRFGECERRMEQSAEALSRLVGGIAAAAAEARDAAESISRDVRSVSGEVEGQAAAVEETAAALQEIASRISASAKMLERADGMARGAADRTRKGETLARGAVEAVGRIEESSEKIKEIIGLIDGIAFQTNLLALNAAVEAARAGEAGRGFAVVATEVRTLSQRTTEAAASVGELIRQSAEAVNDGVRMVQDTGAALGEISGSMSGLIEAVGEVAASGREQAEGVSEVSTAIGRIDIAVQSNAAASAAAADAAQGLALRIDGLDDLAGAFTVADGRRGARAA